MKILIDGCAFTRGPQRGIQRYYYNILSRIGVDEDISMYFFSRPVASLPSNMNVILASEHFQKNRKEFIGRAVGKFRRNWAPTRIPRGDVFHSTFFTQCHHKDTPEVLTVYDMIPEMMPFHFAGDVSSEIELKRKCIFSAQKIIVISDATGSDLKRIYPEVSDRIEVIHMGGDHLLNIATEKDCLDDSNAYVVFLGERAGYKNFAALVEASSDQNWPKGVNVIVIGAELTQAELIFLRHRGVESKFKVVVHPGDVHLKRLLSGTVAFVFPSLLEGFGFPMLEAQALGVPVIASDTEVFREVGGGGFIPVNSADPSSLALGVAKALEPEIRKQMAILGPQNVERFSWDKCAEQTVNVWRNAARS